MESRVTRFLQSSAETAPLFPFKSGLLETFYVYKNVWYVGMSYLNILLYLCSTVWGLKLSPIQSRKAKLCVRLESIERQQSVWKNALVCAQT